MPLWITGAVVLILLGFGGVLACRSGGSATVTPPDQPTGQISGVSDGDIDAMLEALENREAPEPTMGAMCYAPMMLPDTVEYICPVCGEKTLYGSDDTWFLSYGIGTCREDAAFIDGSEMLDAVLDETEYCGSCSPGHEDPAMRLTIRYADGTEVTSEVTQFDLTILRGFLSGELFYVTSNDGTQPLQPHASRIRELLGR